MVVPYSSVRQYSVWWRSTGRKQTHWLVGSTAVSCWGWQARSASGPCQARTYQLGTDEARFVMAGAAESNAKTM